MSENVENLNQVWKDIKECDHQSDLLVEQYCQEKSDRQSKVLPGRRSMFFTVTEFQFDCATTFVTEPDLYAVKCPLQPVTKPVVMSTDGVYCLTKMSYEAYLQLSFDYNNGLGKQRRIRRTTLHPTVTGLCNYNIVRTTLPNLEMPFFDFEWNLQIGSNDRSYSTDVLNNSQFSGNYLSRKCLGGYNDRQFEFARPYFLDGNDFFTLTLRPTLVPMSNTRLRLYLSTVAALSNVTASIVVSMVTIGHKVLGHGHRI